MGPCSANTCSNRSSTQCITSHSLSAMIFKRTKFQPELKHKQAQLACVSPDVHLAYWPLVEAALFKKERLLTLVNTHIHSKLISFQLGRSALMVAVQYKRRDVAALLLTAGANPDLQEEVRGAVRVCVL